MFILYTDVLLFILHKVLSFQKVFICMYNIHIFYNKVFEHLIIFLKILLRPMLAFKFELG